MGKFSRKIGALIYYSFAKFLPPSFSGIQIGQRAIRAFCGKLMLKNCGKKVNIEKGATFSAKVSLGDYSGIGMNSRINGDCSIGDYVMMGSDVVVITRNHAFDRTDIPMMHQGFEEEHPVIIGNDVWIAANVTICGGVTVGNGSVIGAGSVVTRDIPEGVLAAGNPCRVIREITDEDSIYLKSKRD